MAMHIGFKKRVNIVLAIMLSAAVLLGSLFTVSEKIHAEDSFIAETKNEYNVLFNDISKRYEEDKIQVSKEFDWLLAILAGEQARMAQIVDTDLKYMSELFKSDYNELEKKYGKQKEYRDKLNDYKREIDPHYYAKALWIYRTTIDRSGSSSAHSVFYKEIDPSRYSGTMWGYKNETDPFSSKSAMWKYRQSIDPSHFSGLMWTLNKECDAYYESSTMWNYRKGKLTLADAHEKMDLILAEGAISLQEIRDESIASITEIRKDSVDTLFKLRDKTADTFLKTRQEAVEKIQAIREKHFGSRLKVEPLSIQLDPIKVLINDDLISFQQPPVIKNGNTLVPMRAIFEQLGAAVEWDRDEFSVTATKDNQTIYLKIGDSKAQLNGETIVLDVPAQIVNANTMVPVRFISESLGALVEWDSVTRTVVISKE